MLFEQADQAVEEPHVLYVYAITVENVVDDRLANDVLPIQLDVELYFKLLFFHNSHHWKILHQLANGCVVAQISCVGLFIQWSFYLKFCLK